MRQHAYYHFYDQAMRGYYRDSSHRFQPSPPPIETGSTDSYFLRMRIAVKVAASMAIGRHACCCHLSDARGADGGSLDLNPWSTVG